MPLHLDIIGNRRNAKEIYLDVNGTRYRTRIGLADIEGTRRLWYRRGTTDSIILFSRGTSATGNSTVYHMTIDGNSFTTTEIGTITGCGRPAATYFTEGVLYVVNQASNFPMFPLTFDVDALTFTQHASFTSGLGNGGIVTIDGNVYGFDVALQRRQITAISVTGVTTGNPVNLTHLGNAGGFANIGDTAYFDQDVTSIVHGQYLKTLRLFRFDSPSTYTEILPRFDLNSGANVEAMAGLSDGRLVTFDWTNNKVYAGTITGNAVAWVEMTGTPPSGIQAAINLRPH